MVFNILARNQDDHVKNVSFLMDKTGSWRLAPAYDITYANDASNRWLARHQMSMNGKLEDFTEEDFLMSAGSMNIKKSKAEKMLADVKRALDKWNEFAYEAELTEEKMEAVRRSFLVV